MLGYAKCNGFVRELATRGMREVSGGRSFAGDCLMDAARGAEFYGVLLVRIAALAR
jgi:hypothetical protein